MTQRTLADILDVVRQTAGIKHKQDIHSLVDMMPPLPLGSYPNGDDTAAIPTGRGDGYNLFATEGFIQSFVESDPWFAGWCGVMVNVSDIAAMGGRPTAVVNAIWNPGDAKARQIMSGIRDACLAFNVPLVGGHTNLQAEQTMLSVSILGHANQLLSSFAAKPGQALVAAIDLRGQYRAPHLNWNAATTATPKQLQGDIEILPRLAELGLACAAKDISQAGLLGTAIMMLESSKVGAEIDLESIPKPSEIPWENWLCSFPSFGYLLTTDKHNLPLLLEEFHQRNIAAAEVGRIISRPLLTVKSDTEYELFWDIEHSPLMGLQPSHTEKISTASRPANTTPPYATANVTDSPKAPLNDHEETPHARIKVFR